MSLRVYCACLVVYSGFKTWCEIWVGSIGLAMLVIVYSHFPTEHSFITFRWDSVFKRWFKYYFANIAEANDLDIVYGLRSPYTVEVWSSNWQGVLYRGAVKGLNIQFEGRDWESCCHIIASLHIDGSVLVLGLRHIWFNPYKVGGVTKIPSL